MGPFDPRRLDAFEWPAPMRTILASESLRVSNTRFSVAPPRTARGRNANLDNRRCERYPSLRRNANPRTTTGCAPLNPPLRRVESRDATPPADPIPR